LESQFRCGKCGKPLASKYSKCLECGYLGPHNFNSLDAPPIEEASSSRAPRRKDTYPAERLAPEQPFTPPHERFETSGAVDLPPEPPVHSAHDEGEDSRFPAGMRSRSPILRDIEDIDRYEEKETKNSSRNMEPDSKESSEDTSDYGTYGSEQEGPSRKRPNNRVTMIVSITLVLILIVAAIYILGNFDDVTRWLASPTIPNVVRPSN
jgi:hypothetical protein